MARTECSIVIEAPIAYAWARTNDVRGWPDLFTEYAAVEVLEDEPDRVVFRLTMHPDENGKVWSWVSERSWDRSQWTVRARRIETGPFEFMNILWTFEAMSSDRTLMRWVQEFHMRPDAPMNDAQMEERIMRGSHEQMRIIARRILAARAQVRDFDASPSTRARGGDMRMLLTPVTVGSSAAVSGAVELAPGERVDEHYHPYSEEFLYLSHGTVQVDVDGRSAPLRARQAVLIPRGRRHRVTNTGAEPALVVFTVTPLAPTPEAGHVYTEGQREPAGAGTGEDRR
jgi:aromatase